MSNSSEQMLLIFSAPASCLAKEVKNRLQIPLQSLFSSCCFHLDKKKSVYQRFPETSIPSVRWWGVEAKWPTKQNFNQWTPPVDGLPWLLLTTPTAPMGEPERG
jgi:hypothetical protein